MPPTQLVDKSQQVEDNICVFKPRDIGVIMSVSRTPRMPVPCKNSLLQPVASQSSAVPCAFPPQVLVGEPDADDKSRSGKLGPLRTLTNVFFFFSTGCHEVPESWTGAQARLLGLQRTGTFISRVQKYKYGMSQVLHISVAPWTSPNTQLTYKVLVST